MNGWIQQNLVECLGWTLLHFVWQGLAIWLLLAIALRLLRNATPNKRYLAGCFALTLLAAAPVATLPLMLQQHRPPAPAAFTQDFTPTQQAKELAQIATPDEVVIVAHPQKAKVSFRARLEKSLPLVVLAWSLGVVILSIRLLVGWVRVNRLRRVGTVELEETWHLKLAELGRRLRLTRPVRLVQSALVEVPTVIGWLRPVILLPAGCLLGLTPGQLESILAHELAHIRRHDYLVNLLQSVVETFLFYHPAVWWVSRRIREEREHCCDDLAVEVCGDRAGYARALATLEELRLAPASLALAAGGAPLLQRIRRLAGKPVGRLTSTSPRSAWPAAGVVVLLMLVGLCLALRGNRAEARDDATVATNKVAGSVSAVKTNKKNVELEYRTRLLAANENPYPGMSADAVLEIKKYEAEMARLENFHLDSIQFDAVPLEKVISDLSARYQAQSPDHQKINFVFSQSPPEYAYSDEPNPVPGHLMNLGKVKITINPALTNLSFSNALDAIEKHADSPICHHYNTTGKGRACLIFRADDQLEVRTFLPGRNSQITNLLDGLTNKQDALNDLMHVYRMALHRAETNKTATQMLRPWLESVGVDMDTNRVGNRSKAVAWLSEKGELYVRATPKELDLIESHLQKGVTNRVAPSTTNKAPWSMMDPEPKSVIKDREKWSQMESVRFKNVEYDSVPLLEVFKDLNSRYQTQSPNHQSLPFYFYLNYREEPVAALSQPMTGGRADELASAKVTIKPALTNVSISEVLSAIKRLSAGSIWAQYAKVNGTNSFVVFGDDHLSFRNFGVGNVPLFRNWQLPSTNLEEYDIDFLRVQRIYIPGHGTSSASTRQLLPWLKSIGVDMDTNGAENLNKVVAWNSKRGTLDVRATPKELDLIESYLKNGTMNQVAPSPTNQVPSLMIPAKSDSDSTHEERWLRLESSHLISVRYDSVPLDKVLNDFRAAYEAQGPNQKLSYAFDKGLGSVKVTINPAISNLNWQGALKAIKEHADSPIGYHFGNGSNAYLMFFSGLGNNASQPFRFNSIRYDSVSLDKVLNDLSTAYTAQSPEHQTIHFYLTRNGSEELIDYLSPPVLDGKIDLASVKIGIKYPLTNLTMTEALDAIVKHADAPISYQCQYDGKVVSRVVFKFGEKFETRTFKVVTNIFYKELQTFFDAHPGGVNNETNLLRAQIQRWLRWNGLDMDTNRPENLGKAVVYNDGKGILFLRATPKELDLVRANLQKALTPKGGINLSAKVVRMEGMFLPDKATGGPPAVVQFTPGFQTNLVRFQMSQATTNALEVSNSIIRQFSGVIASKNFGLMINYLEKEKGTEVINLPEVKTESGRQCQFQAVDLMTVVTDVQPSHDTNGKPSLNYKTENKSFGPIVDVIPQYSISSGLIDLKVTSTVTEFLGYDKSKRVTLNGLKAEKPMPRYKLQQLTADASLEDGSTLMLGGVESPDDAKDTKGKPKKNLLVFITVHLLNPDGTPVHPPVEK